MLSMIFTQIPWEYGFSGATGKKYEAAKDLLEWNGFDVKEWTPVVLNMGSVWISSSKKEK